MINWRRFVEIVAAHQRFLLTTHIRPDGDALGSQLAMAGILRSLGKEVKFCNAFTVPPNLRFLDPERQLKQLGIDFPAEELNWPEVLIILDTSANAQLGAMAEPVKSTKALKIIIDHHIGGDIVGAEMFKNTQADATGRLVVEAADALGIKLDAQIARCAMVALATDTGWFRFSSTTADTLRLAARLVEAGAIPDQLYSELYENDSLGRLRLIGCALARSETKMNGRLIYTWLRLDDFAAVGALPSDSEDIINMTFSVGGTQAAVIMVEQPSGGYKVSFRSRCELNCSAVAERFGGGGHKRAAGALLKEPLEAVTNKILDAVCAAMQAG